MKISICTHQSWDKIPKSICENAVWNLCLAVGENEAEALKEPQLWLLCAQGKTLLLHSSGSSDHRVQPPTNAGNAAADPLLSTGAGVHLATQALLLLWGYHKTQLKDPLQESRTVRSQKLLWNLLVTVQKCVPQTNQFQQILESNIL